MTTADALNTVDSSQPTTQRVRRARAFRRPGLLWLTALLYTISFAALVAFIVFGARMYFEANKQMGIYSLIAIGVMVVTRIWAALNSRNLTCHLCMGTVLHEKSCHKHAGAKKLPLLSYRTTAVLSTLFGLGFTCMYCGSPYRLKK